MKLALFVFFLLFKGEIYQYVRLAFKLFLEANSLNSKDKLSIARSNWQIRQTEKYIDQIYWVTQKLPQTCTVILRICIGKVSWFAVYICGNFWVNQYTVCFKKPCPFYTVTRYTNIIIELNKTSWTRSRSLFWASS